MRADRGHEAVDIKSRGIVIFLIALAVLTILVLLAMRGLFVALENRATRADLAVPRDARDTGAAGAATQDGARRLAEPLLQTNPPVALADLRAAEERVLTTYGWINADVGIVRVPIEHAIDLLAERGLPARPADAASHAAESGVPADDVPRDANSGRGNRGGAHR
ncbi:MAG: hypothetical protein ACKVU1_18165 [bacterium]